MLDVADRRCRQKPNAKIKRIMDTSEDRIGVLCLKLWAYLRSKLVIGKKFSPNRGNRLPARPMKTTWELTPGILQKMSLYKDI